MSGKEWLCDFPWKYLFVNVQGEVSFCCTNTPKRGSLHEQDFEEIWNGVGFQLARAQFRERRYLEAKCLPSCQWLIKEIPRYATAFENGSRPVIDDASELERYKADIKPLEEPHPLSTDFIDNIAALDKDIAEESLITSARPTRAHIEIIQSCNLYCNFCDIGITRPKERFIDNIVLDRLKPAYRFLTQIEILGGEIFSVGIERSPLRRILEDIEEATKDNPEPVEILLVTNAVSLGSSWADFLTTRSKNLRLNISISIDTLDEENYPLMRVGGRLEKTLQNIRRLRQYIDDRNCDIEIIFTSVLCDLTYPSIPRLVAFTTEMKGKFLMLQPLQKTGDQSFYDQHNIFNSNRPDDVMKLKSILEPMPDDIMNKQNILMICSMYAPIMEIKREKIAEPMDPASIAEPLHIASSAAQVLI